MSDVVNKLWGFCHTLRHDGVDYGDYIEQLTYLLFLKMADEREVHISKNYLSPDKRNKIDNVVYEEKITNFFTNLNHSLRIPIKIKTTDKYTFSKTETDIQKIGADENADLILWAYFDENCTGDAKTKIKYQIVNKNSGSEIIKLDSLRITSTTNPIIKSGFIENNPNSVINRMLAIYLFHLNDFNSTIEIINKVIKDSCDIEMLSIKCAALYNTGSIDREIESIKTMIDVKACINNKYNVVVSRLRALLQDHKCEDHYNTIIFLEKYCNEVLTWLYYAKQIQIGSGTSQFVKSELDKQESEIYTLLDFVTNEKKKHNWI